MRLDWLIHKKRKLGDGEKQWSLEKGDRLCSRYFSGEREFQYGNGAEKGNREKKKKRERKKEKSLHNGDFER